MCWWLPDNDNDYVLFCYDVYHFVKQNIEEKTQQ